MSLLLLFQSDAAPPVDPDIGHRYVTAELLDYDGSVMPGDPLVNAFGVNWYDEWDGPGRGGCSLPLSEAGSADLLPGRYVNCVVSNGPGLPGQTRFTFKIEGNPEYDMIKRGEEKEQIITVQGRGSRPEPSGMREAMMR